MPSAASTTRRVLLRLITDGGINYHAAFFHALNEHDLRS